MCDKYKQRLIKIEDPSIQMKQQKAIEIKANYLTRENLQQILGFLFNEYLLMTEEELDVWRDSPEEFINEDGTATDAWKYNYRACAETLFQAFVHEYHDLVVPIVVELIEVYSKIKPIENADKSTTSNINSLNNNVNINFLKVGIFLVKNTFSLSHCLFTDAIVKKWYKILLKTR